MKIDVSCGVIILDDLTGLINMKEINRFFNDEATQREYQQRHQLPAFKQAGDINAGKQNTENR
ncbi:hypothetical protein HYN43_023875 [Mucilaginibacter celer]|uniref:Uncharacterized protein n=1 Tax=Mucilaginibacter celer TaxID=2305508 RepID=A0A494VRB6_9SPHI|nr:hypothetical protein HYN43_023875 [Mucilaginibacter celer]